jgi:hypothetical protein
MAALVAAPLCTERQRRWSCAVRGAWVAWAPARGVRVGGAVHFSPVFELCPPPAPLAVEVCLRKDSIARPSDLRERVKVWLESTVAVYRRGA